MKNTTLTMGQWESRINDIFNTAIICKHSHTELLERFDKHVYSELNRKYANGRRVYPAYMSGFVQGLMTVHRANLWRYHLEFCYMVDGVLYSTHKESDKRKTEEFYKADKGHLLSSANGKHYWKHSDKAFS